MTQLLAAGAKPDGAAPSIMSATAIAVLLLMALAVDYLNIGPNWLQGRGTFLLGVPAIRQGWDGSPLDQWTVMRLTDFVQWMLNHSGSIKIAGASALALVGVLALVTGVYCLGCLMPVKMSKTFGRFVTLSFPTSPMMKINFKLWAIIFAIGMLIDLPGGWLGDLFRGAIDLDTSIVGALPKVLFGVSE